jgi:hypothetical protein
MNTKLSIVLAASVALFVSACGSSPQSLIVGKWQVSGAQVEGVDDQTAAAAGKAIKMSAEFSKDGTARMTMMGQTLQGTYKIDGDELVWTMNGITTKGKLKVSATELDVTDAANRTIKYTRM